jgi:hypothetical protein
MERLDGIDRIEAELAGRPLALQGGHGPDGPLVYRPGAAR